MFKNIKQNHSDLTEKYLDYKKKYYKSSRNYFFYKILINLSLRIQDIETEIIKLNDHNITPLEFKVKINFLLNNLIKK